MTAVRRALVLLGCWLVAAAGAAGAVTPALERAVAVNLAVTDLAAPAVLDSLLQLEQDDAVAVRVGRWARRYAATEGTTYRFGLADGGYVERGLLVPGLVHDCISLVYRVTELAQARTARHAIELALSSRFAGADLQHVVDGDGKVDYDRPEHLDYSLDMIRTGLWGHDVTGDLAGAVLDTVGSSRYRSGSFHYLPGSALADADLREGDIVWFVLDPAQPAARALRFEHGLVIGHAGIVIREGGVLVMVHAASRALLPWYDRAGVVTVPLGEYLRRVERYHGVVVTRW